MTAAARATTRRVSRATPGIAPTFRTSRPCAVTTSGASTDEAISPDGTRKCAHTTSAGAAERTARRNSRYRRLPPPRRSEEHTSELQSRENLVCRLLLETKKEVGFGHTPYRGTLWCAAASGVPD